MEIYLIFHQIFKKYFFIEFVQIIQKIYNLIYIINMIKQQHPLELVRNILQKFPKIGVYKGQTNAEWRSFFNYFVSFLQSEQGPRGDVIKYCRSILNKDVIKSNKLLNVLGLNVNSSVRDIYVKYEKYMPCQEYVRYLKQQIKLEKTKKNNDSMQDDNSEMTKSILKGLKDKHGEEYGFSQKIEQLRQSYQKKLANIIKSQQQLLQVLKKNPKYLQYIQMTDYLKPFLIQWEKVDKETGNNNVIRGKNFEEKCLTNGINQIFQRLGKSNYQIFTNCNWSQKELGQIDIAFAENIEGKTKISVLVECKSRVFDLKYAYKQIGPDRLKFNKKFLNTKKGQIQVLDDCKIFILTTLPEYEYILPIESSFKGELQKLTKNITVSQLDEQKLYQALSNKFSNQLSPLEWFDKYGNQVVIVID